MTTQTLSRSESIEKMLTAAYAGDWNTFESYLHDDASVKYGHLPPITGARAISESQQKMMKYMMRLTDAQVLAVHETENTVIVEYNITGVRLSDNQQFVFPCVDVYQFEGDRVAEWRVYPLFVDFAVGSESGDKN